MNQKPLWICPSILSADFAKLGEDVKAVIDAGADRIHIDIMDNHYVPNLTFGPMICRALRDYGIDTPLDVHLMVEPVDALIQSTIDAGASCIVIHPEASKHVDRSLRMIKDAGLEAGLALNPITPASCLEYVTEHLDRILLMSVNPGFPAQKFIPATLKKAYKVREFLNEHAIDARLEIDGGMNPDNIKMATEAGIDTVVAGNAIFNQTDYAAAIARLRQNASN